MNTDRPTTLNEACTHKTRHLHGTYTCYRGDGCRCTGCVEAQSQYMAAYKERRDAHPLGELWEPGSTEWLAAMRRGLLTAVVESFERDGESRFL